MRPTSVFKSLEAGDYAKHGLPRERLLQMLRRMIEIRRFEERVEYLFLREGVLIGPSRLYFGQAAVAAGAIPVLNDDLITTFETF